MMKKECPGFNERTSRAVAERRGVLPALQRLARFFRRRWDGRRQFFHLQDVHAEIADFVQTQSGKLWHCLADSAKDIVDGENGVSSADCLEQVPQNFPIVARVTGRPHRAIQSLQSAFAIDHRAAFFGKTAPGKNDCRFFGRLIRQNIHHDQHRELRELFNGYAQMHCVFFQNHQRLDFSGFHGIGDRKQVRAWFRLRSKNESCAVCIWIAVFAEQDVITGLAARDNVDSLSAQRLCQL